MNKSKLKNINSRDIGLMIKVVEEQYLQDTLSGNLFFGSLNIYKDAENEQNDRVIGDASEGKLISNFEAFNICIKNEEIAIRIPVNNKKTKLTCKVGMSGDQNIGICSFTYLSFDDFEEYQHKEDRIYFKLRQSVINDMSKFIKEKEKFTGRKCQIALFEPNEFCNILDKDSSLIYDFVKYYDKNNLEEFMNLEKRKILTYFCKSKNYLAQREFRVAKVLDKGSRGEIVKVGAKETIGIQVTLSELKNYILIAERIS